MTNAELDEIMIHRWPILIRWAMQHGDDFARDFTRSIARKNKRASWHPSLKEQWFMRRFLAEMAQHDPEVLE